MCGLKKLSKFKHSTLHPSSVPSAVENTQWMSLTQPAVEQWELAEYTSWRTRPVSISVRSVLHISLSPCMQHSIELLHKSPNAEKIFGDEVPDRPRSGKECHFLGLGDGLLESELFEASSQQNIFRPTVQSSKQARLCYIFRTPVGQ
jgi:hypothetical protein